MCVGQKVRVNRQLSAPKWVRPRDERDGCGYVARHGESRRVLALQEGFVIRAPFERFHAQRRRFSSRETPIVERRHIDVTVKHAVNFNETAPRVNLERLFALLSADLRVPSADADRKALSRCAQRRTAISETVQQQQLQPQLVRQGIRARRLEVQCTNQLP